MATISENLEALKTAKTNIKSAIEGKGQDLTDVPFAQYGEKIEAIQTSNVDLSQTTATADDVLQGKEFYNANGEKVTGTYKDMLQEKVNGSKSCAWLFSSYEGESLDFAKDLDTSGVTTMVNMFSFCTAITKIPIELDTSNATNMGHMFYMCEALTEVPVIDVSKATSTNNMFYGCASLTEIPTIDTSNATNMGYMFYNCDKLITIPLLDVGKIMNTSYGSYIFDGCRNLKNLTLKNIKLPLKIGIKSGTTTSWGHLLTLDSLLNTIKELWTNTSGTKTLTMGSTNTAKLADVYVKLIAITDEMRAEDEYIDNKAPFEVCESTDEGAMLITEYVTTVKKWTLA